MVHMKNATIKFLLPNAFPISKTGFYNEIQDPKVKISPRGFSLGLWRSCRDSRGPRPSGRATRDRTPIPVRVTLNLRLYCFIFGSTGSCALSHPRSRLTRHGFHGHTATGLYRFIHSFPFTCHINGTTL